MFPNLFLGCWTKQIKALVREKIIPTERCPKKNNSHREASKHQPRFPPTKHFMTVSLIPLKPPKTTMGSRWVWM